MKKTVRKNFCLPLRRCVSASVRLLLCGFISCLLTTPVRVLAAPANSAPVAYNSTASATEDGNYITGRVKATDADGDALTYTVVSTVPQKQGTLYFISRSGTYYYVPAKNFYGVASFTFQARDNRRVSNIATVSINVAAVNDAPSFTKGASQTCGEDAPSQNISGWATAISAGPNEASQTVSFVVSNTNNGLFATQPAVAANGTLTYKPALNASGSATVSVRLTDNGGVANGGVNQSAVQTFTITVNAVNDAPVAVNGTLTTKQGTPKSGAVSATDVDNAAIQLSYAVVAQAAHGSVAMSANGNYTYTPTATYAGADAFTFRASDGAANSNIATVSITVTAAATPSIQFTQSSQSAEVEQGKTQSLLEYISTSDGSPTSANLTAADGNGVVPAWLTVNGKNLTGIPYTTGSEITFDFDATNLSVGTYAATVTAAAPSYKSAVLNLLLTVKAGSTGTPASLKINFQDSATKTPVGWLADFGQPFGPRTLPNQGSGNTYGWINRADNTPVNLTSYGRKRTTPADTLLATLMQMQYKNAPEGIWEAQVANGNYDVTLSVGDGSYTDSKHFINVEGVPAVVNFVPTASNLFKTATVSVTVADGLLTVDAIGGTNTKINYISIQPSTVRRPSVVSVNPENGSQNVSDIASISTNILNLPNGGIDNNTITSDNVYLEEDATKTKVPAHVNGTGGGDAITLVPDAPLKLNTTYVFTITNGVKDLTGATFIPYASNFTTGSVSTGEVANVKFTKVDLPTATGRHSSLIIGPDGKLYALSIDGVVKRFTINSDGTLQSPELLTSLQNAYGGQRLAIGLVFDPASTASNLIAYVTHCTYVFTNAPDWDGKLTRLSGANLENVQDILINLPRSAKDHVTNSEAFGPDGALYFTQGSTSAMGRADQTWSNRDEHLLNAAVLRLDLQKLTSLPLNVKTAEGGGTYSPYAPGAPLTIYASGVRNAFDLVWHSNGELYTATNGSAAGGNTPASVQGTLRTDGTTYNGPAIPALTNVQQTQKDFLYRIKKGGYYGHPNPLRGEYVMNGGNPTSSVDPGQVDAYPVGTLPDANWRGYAFDFQTNKSPNGSIEYKSNTFGGALKGKLMIVRYSQNDDIITLTPSSTTKDIVSYNEGATIQGFSGFADPLDLTEDVRNGNLYVSEYGGEGKITLLRPDESKTTTRKAMIVKAAAGDTTVSPAVVTSAGNLSLREAIEGDSLEKPRVYPNPLHQQFTIQFPTVYQGAIRLYLADVAGRNMELGKLHLKAGGASLDVNLSKLALVPGVYFLKIYREGGKQETVKLLLR